VEEDLCQFNLILVSRQGFGEHKTEQLGGHSQEQQQLTLRLISMLTVLLAGIAAAFTVVSN